mgnify:CR=1 FL=1
MADTGQEKTEQPTPKRRKEAKEKGQVVKSIELNSVIILIGAITTLYFIIEIFITQITQLTRQIFLASSNTALSTDTIQQLTNNGLNHAFNMLSPIFILLLILGLGVNIVQVGFNYSTKPLMPKFEKVNPAKGLKRIFSLRSIAELVKGIIKISIVAVICYFFIKNQIGNFSLLAHSSIDYIVKFVGETMFTIFVLVSIALIIPAIGDYAYQKWEHEKNLKMTKQEVKEESKDTEGNPQIKGKIRSLQMQASRRRMMQAVPDATVVVTNPTHIAIALQYDLEWKGKAPKVLALGKRKTAERIKEIAKNHNIPIVEDKPLARALIEVAQIGYEVPQMFFMAIAEILARVFKNK